MDNLDSEEESIQTFMLILIILIPMGSAGLLIFAIIYAKRKVNKRK